MEKCRQEVCSKLGLEPSEVELSMGMSQDFEQAVGCSETPCMMLQQRHSKHAHRKSVPAERLQCRQWNADVGCCSCIQCIS